MSQTFLYSMIAIISLGAFLVMFVHGYLLKKEKLPASSVLIQGALATVALVLLLVYVFRPNPEPVECMVLFTIAMSGSLVLTAKDLAGGKIPKWLAFVHSLLSFGGFAYIFIFTYLHP